MNTFKVCEVLEVDPYMAIAVSNTLRIEALLYTQSYPSLQTASEMATSLLRREIYSSNRQIIAMWLEEGLKRSEFRLNVVIKRHTLNGPPDRFQIPNCPYQKRSRSSSFSYLFSLLSKESVFTKTVKQLNCELLNEALGEAVSLLVLAENGYSRLRNIDCFNENYLELILLAGKRTLAEDIADREKQRNPYNEQELVKIVLSLSDCLFFAHQKVSFRQGIVHGDLKASVVHLKKRMAVQLYGFRGYAREVQRGSEDEESRIYMCPEWRTLQNTPAEAADVFALGVLFLHCACFRLPVNFNTSETQSLAVLITRTIASLKCSLQFKQLLGRMLNVNPKKRALMKEVVKEIAQIKRLFLEKSPVRENPKVKPEADEQIEKELLSALENKEKSGKIGDLEPSYSALLEFYLKQGQDQMANKVAYQAISAYTKLNKSSKCSLFRHFKVLIDLSLTHHCLPLAKQVTNTTLAYVHKHHSPDSEVLYCYQQLASLCMLLGQAGEAHRYVCLGLKSIGGNGSAERGEMMIVAANACFVQGKTAESEQWARKALELQEKLPENTQFALIPVLSLLIRLTNELHHYDEYRFYALRLINIHENLNFTENCTPLYKDFASVCLKNRAYSDLETLINRLIAENRLFGQKLWCTDMLALCCYKQKKYIEAEKWYLQVLSRKRIGGNYLKTRGCLKKLIKTRKKLGKIEGFAEICRDYFDTFEEFQGEKRSSIRTALIFLQKCAEQANLPLLAEEFHLKTDFYAGKAVSWVATAKNYSAQSEFSLLKAVYSEALLKDQNHFDTAELLFLLTQSSPARPSLALALIKTCKFEVCRDLQSSLLNLMEVKDSEWCYLPPLCEWWKLRESFEMYHWNCYKAGLVISLLAQSFLLQQKLLLDTGDSAGAAKADRAYHRVMKLRQRVSRLVPWTVDLARNNVILGSLEAPIQINWSKFTSLILSCYAVTILSTINS